jgi:hypothetical protein
VSRTPDQQRALEDRIVDSLPEWRKRLVWDYGLKEVLSVDANVPERATAQLEARRKAHQEAVLKEAALPTPQDPERSSNP